MWAFYFAIPPSISWIHYRRFNHAVVIIHTHSDDTTGDLWFCSCDDESGSPAAMPIGDVCMLLPTLADFDVFSSSLKQLLAQR